MPSPEHVQTSLAAAMSLGYRRAVTKRANGQEDWVGAGLAPVPEGERPLVERRTELVEV